MTTDVVIGYDTTGSMYPCITEVRRRIKEMLPQLFDNIPDLRVGMIAFGDYCDYPNMYFVQELTDNQVDLENFIKRAPNTDGGDYDEFYELILHMAQSFDWKADNKVFMLIADAEPHSVGYKYRQFTNEYDWREEARVLAKMGVTIYPIQALGRSASEYFYKGLADVSNSKKLNLNQFSDAVETIISVCYNEVGRLEEYGEILTSGFRMNRNLAELFKTLKEDVKIKEVDRYTKSDSSGLIRVPPARFQILHVDYTTPIKPFVLRQGVTFKTGRGFYQFTKSEMIQEKKEVVLRNKVTGDMFTGPEARNYIGLPFGKRGQIRPHYFEDYEVYVQSTSVNRKLVGGTKFLYENEYWS